VINRKLVETPVKMMNRMEEITDLICEYNEEVQKQQEETERLKIIEEKYKDSQLYIKDFKDEIERLNKALLDIKKLVVNNACLDEEINKCVDDLIYYKCDELLDIVNKALGSDKE